MDDLQTSEISESQPKKAAFQTDLSNFSVSAAHPDGER